MIPNLPNQAPEPTLLTQRGSSLTFGKEMLRRIIIAGAVAVLGGCAGAPSSTTSAAHVVVPSSQLPGTSGQAAWSPSEAQIASCEAAIGRTLASRKRDLGSYYLRLRGVIRDGRRHIVGIAADKRVPGTHYLQPPSEETIVLPAFGGGEAFFSFDYDSDFEKLVRLDFNAPL